MISQESGDEPTSSGIVQPVDDVDNTLQAGEIPQQIARHAKHAVYDHSMPQTPPMLYFGQLNILEDAVDGPEVCERFGNGKVYHNVMGENKMEKWREKLLVGEELENEEAIMVVYSAGGAGDPGLECEIVANSVALEEAQLETRRKVENRPPDTGINFQAIAGAQRRSTQDEHSTGNHAGEGGFLGASRGPEERRNCSNALELVDADLQESHEPRLESSPVGQKAAEEQASEISAWESISPFYRRKKTREKQVQEDRIEQDEYCTAGWLPRRDNEQIYRKSDNALLTLNQRLEEGYSIARARLRITEPLREADNDVFAQQAATLPRAINHERTTTWKTFRQRHLYDFITTSGQPIMRSLAEEELRTAREWKPGGTGRNIVRLPQAGTVDGEWKTGPTVVAIDEGLGVAEHQCGGVVVVESMREKGRLRVDARKSQHSSQTSDYAVQGSRKLEANEKVLEQRWIMGVHIATACGVASSWVLSEGCGDKIGLMYYSHRFWDPGGARHSWHSSCCLRALS